MSVIIKGVDIPKNCSECPCCRHDSLDGLHRYQCNVKLITFGEFDSWIFKKRPNWCPLRPLPEKHGRLKDVDAIIEDIRKNSESYFADDFAHEWIERQPTIVEAEGDDG